VSLILKEIVANPQSAKVYFDAGLGSAAPRHVHTCPDVKGAHTWECNSPYCTSIEELCPDHGGEPPVKVGREPWRR